MITMKKAGLVIILLGVFTLVALLVFRIPSIPHSLEGKKKCITCHSRQGMVPYPKWHEKHGYGNDDCTGCHQLASGATE